VDPDVKEVLIKLDTVMRMCESLSRQFPYLTTGLMYIHGVCDTTKALLRRLHVHHERKEND
jgi:hypothetical protein